MRRTAISVLVLLGLIAGSVSAQNWIVQDGVARIASFALIPQGTEPPAVEGTVYYDGGDGTLYVRTSDQWVNALAAGEGGEGAPTNATYITQTSNAALSNEQALSALSSGIMRVATTTGVITSLGDQLPLANGGTGASLSDPGADRVLFWDDSAGAVTFLTIGSGLSLSDTTLTATGGAGAEALDDLTDVTITDAQDGDVLTYDSDASAWINAALPAGNFDPSANQTITGDWVFQGAFSWDDGDNHTFDVELTVNDGDIYAILGSETVDRINFVGSEQDLTLDLSDSEELRLSASADVATWTFKRWDLRDEVDADAVEFSISNDGAGGSAALNFRSAEDYGGVIMADQSGLEIRALTETENPANLTLAMDDGDLLIEGLSNTGDSNPAFLCFDTVTERVYSSATACAGS